MKNLLLSLFLLITIHSIHAQKCWKTVSAGIDHTVAIRQDGTLWAWGFNGSGQLGDGTTDEKKSPVQIGTDSNWKEVAAGGIHTLAIKSDGTLWAWGDNLWGQVGNGSFGSSIKSPIKIGTATDWKSVSAGRGFSAAIKTNGTLWTWGENLYGQLGHGSASFVPKQVGTATDWRDVSAGGYHIVALKTNNALWTWGQNLYGQLGNGTNTESGLMAQLGVETNWQSVSAGLDFTIAIKSNGTLWAWGNNDSGQLGNGTTTEVTAPAQIGTLTWKAISAGHRHSLAVNSDGTLWVWGFKIGGAVPGEDEVRLSPAQLTSQSNWESVTAGDDHAFAFQTDGSLWGWGDNTWGKLGNDTWIDQNEPQNIFSAPPTGAALQTFCAAAVVSELSVSGTNIRWYNAPNGGLELSPSTPLADGVHYYAAQTKFTCESLTRLDVEVSLRTTPVEPPTGQSNYIFCNGEKLEAVPVTGNGIRWFDAPTDGFELSPTLVELTNNAHYYASQTIDGCGSTQRLDVMTIINSTTPPTTLQSTQTFCESGAIADLSVSGSNINWYTHDSGGSPLPTTATLVSGTDYFASSTVGSLESCTRLKVNALITTVTPPTGETRQAFCKSGVVVNLKATGTDEILWYNAPTGGSAYVGFENLVDGLYYASQKIGTCESPSRLQVQVVINKDNTPAPTGAAMQTLCDQATLRDIDVMGQNIKWYWSEEVPNGYNLPDDTKPLEVSYYATQTIDACESTSRLKVTVSTNRASVVDFPGARPLHARMVSAGDYFSVAIMDDGTLWAWGENQNGELGIGSHESKSTPTMVSGEKDWVQISAGAGYVIALRSDGTLWGWGSNSSGELGDGTQAEKSSPIQIGTDADWKMVAVGNSHTLALKENGTLWSCGWNHVGQTGIITDRSWPLIGLTQVGTANDWQSIAAGGSQSLALKTDGTLWTWGKIGNGTNEGSTVQVMIPSEQPWRSIAAGLFHVLCIKMDGSLWAWGSNEYDQLGDGGDFDSQGEPVRVGTDNDWNQVSGGFAHTVAIKDDGSLWGWGQNAYSQVGVPYGPPYTYSNAIRIDENSDWKSISAGTEHNIAIRNDGSLWTWGRNLSGEIGDGTTLQRLFPWPLRKDELYLCGSSALADVVTNANEMTWYDAAEGGNILTPSSTIISGNYYYVSQTINSIESCYRRGIRIHIGEVTPTTPSGNSVQTLCFGSNVSDLMATGSDIRWYNEPIGGDPLSSSTPLVNGNHYYASQTAAGCESASRMDVSVVLNTTVAPQGNSVQTFCHGSNVSDLIVIGSSIRWYNGPIGGVPLSPSLALINGNHYYASQTVGGCESASRMDVRIVINTTVAPQGNSVQTFCHGSNVSQLMVIGSNILWYQEPTGGVPLSSSLALINGNHYYASQKVGGCESLSRMDVSVILNKTDPPQGNSEQSFCSQGKVSDLTVTGSEIRWFADEGGGAALSWNTPLTNHYSYFASQTLHGCESEQRLKVTISINETPPAPVGEPLQQMQAGKTVADLVVSGNDIRWYHTIDDALVGVNQISLNEVLESNSTYYATQTISGCESSPLAIRVSVIVGIESLESSLELYPIPTGDFLIITFPQGIDEVSVINSVGYKPVTKIVQANRAELNLSSFTPGVYLVKIRSGSNVFLKKIIKL